MRKITKQQLLDWGLRVEQDENGDYHVYHCRELGIHTALCKHPHGTDKEYPIVVFSHKGKTTSLTLSRLVYAWYIGDVSEKEDVDHIDNDPFNNDLNNLQLLSRKENLKKRFKDNPGGHHNQYR